MAEVQAEIQPVEISTIDTAEPAFDRDLGQYVAVTIVDSEVYGLTWTECLERLIGANETALAHAAKCPDDDPFAPDLLALAAEPVTSQIEDARQAAGYPGF